MVMYRLICSGHGNKGRDANAQMNVELNLDNTRLGIFQMISPMVEWGVGETQGQVKLAGTLKTAGLRSNKNP